jgi:hypothetical protein
MTWEGGGEIESMQIPLTNCKLPKYLKCPQRHYLEENLRRCINIKMQVFMYLSAQFYYTSSAYQAPDDV